MLKSRGNDMNQTIRQFGVLLAVLVIGIGILFLLFPQVMLVFLMFFEFIAIILSIYILFKRTDVTSIKVAWILTLYCLPIVGIFLYLFFGRSQLKSTVIQKKEQQYLHEYVQTLQTNHTSPTSMLKIKNERLAEKRVLGGNRFDILTDGEATFDAIFTAIEEAKEHIHLFYFIIKEDELAEKLKKSLIKKAQEGVKVRFAVDGLGSLKLSDAYLNELREANVEVCIFNPIRTFYHLFRANWRNHRKVIVIDGRIGFAGGLNIGNEYLGLTEKFSSWRDTHMRLQGPVVTQLQETFLYDWLYMKNKTGSASEFLSEQYFPIDYAGDDEGQVIYGGPYDQERVIRDVFFNMIDSATAKISIASPYFVPDDEMLALLRRVARNGIEVEILIPGKGDRKLSYYGNDFYLETLISAGIKVYKYDNTAFLHCKVMIIDEKIATVGSTNFDIRSFDINHEVSVILYNGKGVKKLAEDYRRDVQKAAEITDVDLTERSRWKKIKGRVCGLFAPLL